MNKENEVSRELFIFKQWSRNSFFWFNNIGCRTKIATLSIVYLLCGFSSVLQAQENVSKINKNININEIKVSARRSPALYSEVGRVVSVISRKEIGQLAVHSVQGLLKYAMGVDIRQRGPLGVQADVSIRGGSFDQVMILLNGINITDPQTGHLSLNLPIDIQSIERVEILEGPASRVYGPNAFSGAINFVTGTKKKNNVSANVMGGDFGLYNMGTNITLVKGKMKNYVALSRSASNGYIKNTDFKTYNAFYQGQLNLNRGKFDLQLGHNNKAFGANSFYTDKFPNQYEQCKVTFASLSFASKGKIKLKSSAYWRRHQDRFELFRDNKNAPTWYKEHNYHLTDILGANFNVVLPWAAGNTAVGGDFRSENIWSNVLGLPSKDKSVPGESNATFNKKYLRNNTSLFLEHTYTNKHLSISGGLMANYYSSKLGSAWNYFPGIDASLWLSSNFKTFISINKSLRMPTFTDLFYKGPTNNGNQKLKPEKATSYELGFKYLSPGINATITSFCRKGKDMIDWGISNDDLKSGKAIYTTSNINNITTLGVELAANIDLTTLIQPNFFIENVHLNYSWLNQDKGAMPSYTSVYVFNYLKHKLNISIKHKIYSHLGATWNLLYQDRLGAYTDVITQKKVDYKPFYLCDLRVHWTKLKYTLYVEACNLFDKQYVDFGNITQPGRWVRAGVKINLDL